MLWEIQVHSFGWLWESRQYVLISVTIGLEKKSQIKTSPFPKHLLFKIESPFLVYLKANWNSILAMQF